MRWARESEAAWLAGFRAPGGRCACPVARPTDGEQPHDPTYVDHVIDAFLQAAASEEAVGQVYNPGGRRPSNHLELIETLLPVPGGGRFR